MPTELGQANPSLMPPLAWCPLTIHSFHKYVFSASCSRPCAGGSDEMETKTRSLLSWKMQRIKREATRVGESMVES